MNIVLSNRLEVLADALRDALFSKIDPFEIPHVIVPSHQIKNFLVYRWAKNNQVVAGIKILTMAEALCLFFPHIPTHIQLSLRIEELLTKNTLHESVATYLKMGGEKRIGSFADQLSSLFLEYGICEKESMDGWKNKPGWQQDLWKQLFPDKTPWEQETEPSFPVYLFHLSFLSPCYWRFFQTKDVQVYHLSPSEMFWGDFVSDTKQAFLSQKEQWETFIKEQNTLLANNGRVYQRFFKLIEDQTILELYETPSGTSSLASIQKEMLLLENDTKSRDLSLQIHSAPSKLREVEVVWEIIQGLGVLPGDIAIYAPDIREYVPYIHMVFGRKESPCEYSIFDLELIHESLLASSLKHFFDLPSSNFDRESLLKLLSFSNFLDKWELSREDAEVLKTWTHKVYIYADIQSLNEEGSWERGLTRLIEALISYSETFTLPLSQADLLGKWIEIIHSLRFTFTPILKGDKKRVSEWMMYIQTIVEQFFSTSEEDAILLKELCSLGKLTLGPFTFTTIARVLEQLFARKEGSFHPGYLSSVKFFSLKPGSSSPSQSVILMGMEDGVFPRLQQRTSLEEITSKETRTATEEDRYLFLEQLLSARSHFILTYTRIDEQDGKENTPSLLVQELLRYMPEIFIKHHPSEAFDESYFQETGFRSHSSFYFAAAKKFYEEKTVRNPVFSLPDTLTFQKKSHVLDIRDLKKLARHPIQFYFEKKHGIYFQREASAYQEFVLSHFDLASFRRASLGKDVCYIIQQAEKQGMLPLGELKGVALYKIKEEIAAYHKALSDLAIDKDQIFSVELNLLCKEPVEIKPNTWVLPPLKISVEDENITLVGKLDDLSAQGVLVHGEDSLDDLIKAWPLYLIARSLPLKIEPYFLLTKEGKKISPPFLEGEKALSHYIKYALIATQTPSPCLPKFAQTLLSEDASALEKAFRSEGQGNFADPILHWIREQEGFPAFDQWHHLWAPLLKEVFVEHI